MKISLSKGELLQILSEHFSREVTDVTIIKGGSPVAEKVKRFLSEKLFIAMTFNQNTFVSDKKIPAIKALREHVSGMGLAEAKWAIENWEQWIKFVEEKNRYPKITFGADWCGGKLS